MAYVYNMWYMRMKRCVIRCVAWSANAVCERRRAGTIHATENTHKKGEKIKVHGTVLKKSSSEKNKA